LRTESRTDMRTNGNVARNNGFGSITGVRPARTLQLVTRLTF
jgi:hypothetical protein